MENKDDFLETFSTDSDLIRYSVLDVLVIFWLNFLHAVVDFWYLVS